MSGAGTSELRFHFGERDRHEGRPLEAAVMDACERRGVAAAVTLRGVEGFGARQRLRTDRLLSLSEDAPLVVVAVGADVGRVKATVWEPRTGPSSPHLDVVAALRRHGADAATVLLGVDGMLEGERRRARFFAANRGVPAITVAVGERSAIEAALADLPVAPSLVTFEAVETFRRIGTESLHGAAARVTLVTSEIATHGARPRYLALVQALREEGAAGATALRGVWGFRGDREPHGDRVLALRRDVPLLVETVDSAERAARWSELALSLAGDDDVVQLQEVDRADGP